MIIHSARKSIIYVPFLSSSVPSASFFSPSSLGASTAPSSFGASSLGSSSLASSLGSSSFASSLGSSSLASSFGSSSFASAFGSSVSLGFPGHSYRLLILLHKKFFPFLLTIIFHLYFYSDLFDLSVCGPILLGGTIFSWFRLLPLWLGGIFLLLGLL